MRVIAIAAMCFAVGCGDTGAVASEDGGTADGTVDSGDAITIVPPAAVAPPNIVCPEGWSDPGDGTPCEPWPETGPEPCGAGQAHLPGSPGCQPIGDPCPAGEWPEGLPTDVAIVYVRAGATGTGTTSDPFGRIADALASAPSGAIVAVARGSYAEMIALTRPVTLWGACAAQTRLAPTTPSALSIVAIAAAGVVVRDLGIGGAGRGITIEPSASAMLSGVAIEGASGVGLLVRGDVVARGLVVRGTRPIDDIGVGVTIESGASVELDRAAIEQNRETGMLASGPSASLVARDVVIRGTLPTSDGANGGGVKALAGAMVSLERIAIEANQDEGIYASTSSVLLRDAVIRDTAPRSTGLGGVGIIAAENGVVDGQRVRIERSTHMGVYAGRPGARIMLADSLVAGTRPTPAGTFGMGARAGDGGRVELLRSIVRGNASAGVLAQIEGSSVSLADVVVEDTVPQASDSSGGHGLLAELAATVDVARARFSRNRTIAVLAMDPGTTLAASDLVVEDSAPSISSESGGVAITAGRGAQLVLERARLERNQSLGLVVSQPGTRAVVSDIAVLDTAPDPRTGGHGGALQVDRGAVLEMSGALFERNHALTVSAFEAETVLRLERAIVRDTRELGCAGTTCGPGESGTGIGAYDGASVFVSDFVVTRSALVGLQIGPGAQMDATRGEVTSNPIGANVQSPGFDVARLSQDVVFRDNGVNLDSQMLPLPEAAIPSAAAPP